MTLEIFLLLILAAVLGSGMTLILFCVLEFQSEYISAREEQKSEAWPSCNEETVFFDPETNYRASAEPSLTAEETNELKNTLLLLRDVLAMSGPEETVKIGAYRYDTADLTGATRALEKLLGGIGK